MATEKTCFKCQETKPLTEFYKHPAMGDGHLGKCKLCTKKDVWHNRQENLDEKREYDRSRASLPHRVEQAKRVQARWRQEHPDRRKAHMAVLSALRSGKIQRLPCWVCGREAEAHHPDYSLPLDVVWLCPPHHRQAHAMTRRTF